MGQVKFVEDSPLKKFSDMVCVGRGCLPQILLGPFLNTFVQFYSGCNKQLISVGEVFLSATFQSSVSVWNYFTLIRDITLTL